MAVTAATYPRTAGEATAGSFNHSRAIFGVVVALIGAAVVLFLYVRGQPQTVEVLKAAHDLQPGTVLQSDDLVAETEPLSDGLSALVVPTGERDAVIGRPLSDGLRRGLPLARAQLLAEAQRIPDNLRVVALPVTPETAAGGQIVAGQRRRNSRHHGQGESWPGAHGFGRRPRNRLCHRCAGVVGRLWIC